MTGGRPLLACAAVAGAVAAGCGGASPATETSAPVRASPAVKTSAPVRADSTVPCSARAEPPPPVGDGLRDQVQDHVTTSSVRLPDGGRFDLYTFPDDLGPSRSRDDERRVWLWKAPAVLTADRSVILTVPAGAARRARLGFTRPARSFARSSRATRFVSCAPDTPLFSGEGTVGPETGWPGSLITLDRRVCLRLRVVTATTSVPLRVPLGTRCRRG